MVDIKEQLSNMNKISKRSVAYYHKFAISIGISDSSLGILYSLLEANKPCSQYDLCNELFMPKQTINTAVNVLKDKGLISITPSQESRNKKNIMLTDKGKDFVKNTIDKLRNAELDALNKLTSEERDNYIALNEKYNEELSKNLECILDSEN